MILPNAATVVMVSTAAAAAKHATQHEGVARSKHD